MFIGRVAGGLLAVPFAARAQQKAMPVIGYLGSGSPGLSAAIVAAFRQGLAETGYVEGQNVAIEYRWAEGHYDRLPALAADLVGRKVDVIVTTGGSAPRAAKAASPTIPIVFTIGGDPVLRTPITGIAFCCARAANGTARRPPATRPMNIRRSITESSR